MSQVWRRMLCLLFSVAMIGTATWAGQEPTTSPTKAPQGNSDEPSRCQLDCNYAIQLSCPTVVQGSTIEEPNNIEHWSCGFDDPGGELVYAIDLSSTVDLTIRITALSAEECVDFYFLEACDEYPCLWIGDSEGDAQTIHDVGPGTVFVVVDRWQGCDPDPYDFEFALTCAEPPASCVYEGRCTEDLGGLFWYADGEWSSLDGLIYQVYVGGSLPWAPDIVAYDPDECEVVRTCQLDFTCSSQRAIAVDTRNGNLWVAGWDDEVIYYIRGDDCSLLRTFGHGFPYAGLAYDSDNERLWAVTNSAPDLYGAFDVSDPMAPQPLWGPFPVPWQCGGTYDGTDFNGAGLEYNPFDNKLIFINQDADAQECFLDNGDGTLTPEGCCILTPAPHPWGCALIDGPIGAEGALYISSSHFGRCENPIDIFRTVCDAPLPVELAAFEAVSGHGHIDLFWTTASENDNDYFKVYRRRAADGWREIARVHSRGNSATVQTYSYRDATILPSVSYDYLLADVDIQGVETVHEELICSGTTIETPLPMDYALYQNYPNPFNPETHISFDIKEASFVTLKVYDLLGREVRALVNGQKAAGHYTVVFSAGELPSGVYMYRLEATDYIALKKMVLLK